MDRRRLLFPPLGERVFLRRPLAYARVPLTGWAWYAQEAWMSAAALALAAVAAVLFAIRARDQRVLPPVEVVLDAPSDAAAPELEPDFEPVDLPGELPEAPAGLEP